MGALHIGNKNVSPEADSYLRSISLNPFLKYSPPPPSVNAYRSPALDCSRNIQYSPPSPSVNVYRSPTLDFPRKTHHQLFLQPNLSLSPPGVSLIPPLPSIENLKTPPPISPKRHVFSNNPVKAEEDVLVMDGILVKSPSTGSGSGSRKLVRTQLQSGSSSGSTSLHRTEICGSWKETGFCSYGSKCPYSHRKEYLLHPSQYFKTNKPQNPAKRQFGHNAGTALAQANQQIDSIDWSPTDDGIVIRLPGSFTEESSSASSRRAIHTYTIGILNGPRREQRLPVFKGITSQSYLH